MIKKKKYMEFNEQKNDKMLKSRLHRKPKKQTFIHISSFLGIKD